MIAIAIVIAGLLLMLLAAPLSHAGRIRKSLRPFVGRSVRLEVWGSPIDPSPMTIDSVIAVGAGLHLYFRSNGHRTHMKIAQPKTIAISGDRIEIPQAKYVQSAGRALPKRDAPAVVLYFTS